MPSDSCINFEKNLIKDVERLFASHGLLNHDGKGRRGLGHITRSGVFMLCAAWEVYHEELIKECVQLITSNIALPDNLPRPTRLVLINHLTNLKDKSKLLHFAGDGWRPTYLNICGKAIRDLNTPNVENLNKLYKDYLGIDNIASFWSIDDSAINEFISIRGDIAHNGSAAKYITINKLEVLIDAIKKTTIENDNAVLDYIRDKFTNGRYPWHRKNV